MNILIVEDSATLRAAIKKLVVELGHQAVLANSGEEALQCVGVVDFDLVIMDVEMPGLNGFETATLMREALSPRWLPIIYATSHSGDDIILAGIEAGGDDFLLKPIRPTLLKAKLIAMQRITEMQLQLTRMNSELSLLSEYDGLTELLNRRAFSERANQAITGSRRQARGCALIMLDIDFFKQYNDCYGHSAGDNCLQQIASRLKSAIKRESDLLARYGGEEFVVLLPDTDRDGARLVANRIQQAIADSAISHRDSRVSSQVTASLGIALSSPNSTLDQLQRSADKNLYRAKAAGRNRVEIDEERGHRTLLIASGNDSELSYLTRALQPLANILTTDNHLECVAMAKDIRPDLILLDSDCAALAAEKTAVILRQHMRTAKTPLLFMGRTDRADIALPLEAEQLREKVQEIID